MNVKIYLKNKPFNTAIMPLAIFTNESIVRIMIVCDFLIIIAG